MMPKFLVKVHPKFGTPWVAILLCGLLYSIFSLQAFAFLVVVDVFLNAVVLLAQFLALALTVTLPIQRYAIPLVPFSCLWIGWCLVRTGSRLIEFLHRKST